MSHTLPLPDETPDLPGPASPAPPAEVDGNAAPPAPKAKRGGSRGKDTLLLGLHVTTTQVYGVLVRPTSGGYEPLRQFVRNRSEGGSGGGFSSAMTPDDVAEPAQAVGFEGGGDSDVMVHFGGGGGIDFSAEFAGMASEGDVAFDLDTPVAAGAQAQPVVFELKDILEECAQAGFARPTLAFSIGGDDVSYTELVVVPDRKKSEKASKKKGKKTEDEPAGQVPAVKRDRLLALLAAENVAFDKERVGFLAMTPRNGQARYLAILPSASEPIVPSLEMLREQRKHRRTAFRSIEAEVPLLVGLSELVAAAEGGENTAVVRVGTEDTIVLLLTGGVLHHVERMQSVTAFDGPDTICSRVLLQQDVQGVGTVHNVVIAAEERERELVQGFAAFYPEARVGTLREGLGTLGLVGPYGPLAPSLVEAAGAAVAGHARGKNGPFDGTDLLPASLRKRKRSVDLTVGWHTLLVAVLLFLSVLFFAYRYVGQKADIAEAEQRLAEFPAEARMSAPQLQARIDSLRQRQTELTASLVALDSLLYGTDKWTQTVLETTRAASATGGIWIEEWQPSGTELGLSGYATGRNRVVDFAQRLNATIQEVSYDAVRDFPVYKYRIAMAIPDDLPQTTRVLREQAGEVLPPRAQEPLAGLGPSTSPPAPAAAAPPAEPAPAAEPSPSPDPAQ